MDSPHKEPVLREVFPWHCVVVVYPYFHIALIVATSWNVCQSIVHLLWRHDNIDLTWISQPLWPHLENVSISHLYLHIATIIMTSWFCRPYQVHIVVIVNSPGDALTSLENHISTLASGRLKLPTTRLFFFCLFCFTICQLDVTTRKTQKLCIIGPPWRESTDNRWNPLTKGQ